MVNHSLFTQCREPVRRLQRSGPSASISGKLARNCVLTWIICIYTALLYGQVPSTNQPRLFNVTVSGTVTDEKTAEPLIYAPVVLKDSNARTMANALTDLDGNFSIDSLPPAEYFVEITFIGYQKYTRAFSLTGAAAKLKLGNLRLKEDTTLLREVVVTAEKPDIDFKPDKKVYSIGKDILSQSGSAGDILNGIPSVTVDAGGAVRLRGNGNVAVLINGRRSGLTASAVMAQIPAASIEKIEVITSPSARYDAAGSAGVINIILKKNSEEGLSGQARLVTGIPNDYNLNTNLNYKVNKLNLFANLGGRYSDYTGFYTTRQTTTGSSAISLHKVQRENRHDDGRLLYIGGDYVIRPGSTFTMAYFKNATKDTDGTTLDYNFGKSANDSTIARHGASREVRSYNQIEANYTRNFDREGKKLTIDTQYDFWNSNKTWDLSTHRTFPLATALPPVRTFSRGNSKDLVLQSDLVNPFKDKSVFESGLKVETRSVVSDFKAEQYHDNDWLILDNIENKLNYNEVIGSGYAQYRRKPGQFSYLLGLRYERTRIAIRDRERIFSKNKHYGRLFPTVNLSYALGKETTLQMSYTRRINRPSLWYLYPFNEVTDFNAQFVGNPDLNPSYTNVVELALLKQWSKFTLNPTIYSHFSTAAIQQYTYRNDKDIFVTIPFNLDRETRYGFELSAIYDPARWLSFNGQFTLYTFRQNGHYEATDFDFSNRSWNGRINMRISLPWKLGLQGRYDLQGPDNNAQSRTKPYYYLAAGLSKRLLKDKATLTLDGTNILNTNKVKTRTTGEDYTIDRTSNFNGARLRLGFTYRFTRKETQVFRSRKEANRD